MHAGGHNESGNTGGQPPVFRSPTSLPRSSRSPGSARRGAAVSTQRSITRIGDGSLYARIARRAFAIPASARRGVVVSRAVDARRSAARTRCRSRGSRRRGSRRRGSRGRGSRGRSSGPRSARSRNSRSRGASSARSRTSRPAGPSCPTGASAGLRPGHRQRSHTECKYHCEPLHNSYLTARRSSSQPSV